MPEKSGYEAGQFCWIELGTTDPAAAKKFYGTLFGWAAEDSDAGDAGTYTMLRLGGRDVAGMYEMMKEQRDQGVPPHWMSYVGVASVDDAAAKVTELGGTVAMGPMDVMDVGRMAVVSDPTGAMFSIWEPKKHKGMGVSGEIATPCWFELATKDAEKSGAFFTGLFGWEAQAQDMGGTTYTMFRQGDSFVGGMMQMTEEWGETPSHWMIYFTVEDCEAACATIESAGGKVCCPPTDVEGVGRFTLATDPQGAFFSVIKLSSPEEK